MGVMLSLSVHTWPGWMDFLSVLVDLFVYQAGDADKAVILWVMLTFTGPIGIKQLMLTFPQPIVFMPVMLIFLGPIVRRIFTANPI